MCCSLARVGGRYFILFFFSLSLLKASWAHERTRMKSILHLVPPRFFSLGPQVTTRSNDQGGWPRNINKICISQERAKLRCLKVGLPIFFLAEIPSSALVVLTSPHPKMEIARCNQGRLFLLIGDPSRKSKQGQARPPHISSALVCYFDRGYVLSRLCST